MNESCQAYKCSVPQINQSCAHNGMSHWQVTRMNGSCYTNEWVIQSFRLKINTLSFLFCALCLSFSCTPSPLQDIVFLNICQTKCQHRRHTSLQARTLGATAQAVQHDNSSAQCSPFALFSLPPVLLRHMRSVYH